MPSRRSRAGSSRPLRTRSRGGAMRDRLVVMAPPSTPVLDPEDTSSGLLEAVQGHLDQAADLIRLDDWARKVLSTHRREVAVSVRVSRDGGTFDVYPGWRI